MASDETPPETAPPSVQFQVPNEFDEAESPVESTVDTDLYEVTLHSAHDALRLRSADVEPIFRLGNSYLVLADQPGAQTLRLNQLDVRLIAEGIASNQLAFDQRRDDLNVSRYQVIYEKEDVRLLQVSPEVLTPGVARPDIMPVHNRFLKVIYTPPATDLPRVVGRAPTLDIDLEDLIALVERDSVESYLYTLESFPPRVTGTQPLVDSRDYLVGKFQEFGYGGVVLDSFTGQQLWDYVEVPAYNVIARKIGTEYPDKQIVIGAHYDAVPGSPGADDNGSGTVGVMEMARVLRTIETDMTIIFVAFDSEETGLHGAWHYADNAVARGDDILMMFNMDMIGELANDSAAGLVHGPDPVFAQTWIDVGGPLVGITGHLRPYTTRSDHNAFVQNGFKVAYLHEDITSTVYHQPDDNTSHVSFDYLTRMIKASLATIYTISNGDDMDRDGVPDDYDNCPTVANGLQTNTDGDEFGDNCDNCPTFAGTDNSDTDFDGFGDDCDNCPTTFNLDQADEDLDGVGDDCDNCLTTPNSDQHDTDGNGIGDACSAIQFASVVENGPPCLEAEVVLVGNSLRGDITVNQLTTGTPDSIVFEILNADCGSTDLFEFFLNEIPIGSVLADETTSCSCNPGIQAFPVTDSDLIAAAWTIGGQNKLRFVKTGDGHALSWARAEIFAGLTAEYVCIYDYYSGSCTGTNLCGTGYTYDEIDAASEFDDIWTDPTPLITTTYTGSTLPETIDISTLPDDDYVLCATAQEELDAPATVDMIRFIVLNSTCAGSDTYEFFLNGVSLGTTLGDPANTCQCDQVETIFEVTNPALLSNWIEGVNEYRFVKTGTGTLFASLQAEVLWPGNSELRCLYQVDGGDCSEPVDCGDLSTDEIDVTVTVDYSGAIDVFNACEAFAKQGEDLIAINGHCPETSRPAALCHDVTVWVEITCEADVSVDNGSYDPDGDPITIVQQPVGPYPVGQTPVELIVTDDGGLADTCAAIVTVIDNTPPLLDIPDIMTMENDPAECGAVVIYDAIATDNCGPVTVTFDPPSGSFLPVGVTLVSCEAEDIYGNVSSRGFYAIVNDTTVPVCIVPADTTIFQCEPTEICLPVACSDDCGSNPELSLVSGPGEIAGASWCYTPSGTGLVTVTVECRDLWDNVCENTFNVNVVLNRPPALTCPDDVTIHWGEFLNAPVVVDDPDGGEMTFNAIPGSPGSVDPITGQVSWQTDRSDVCQHEIGVIVTDSCGLSDTCSFSICVENTPPIIACPENASFCFGQTVEITVGADDPDDGPYALSYSMVSFDGPGTPVIDPASGLIAWETEETPDYTGIFEFTVAVTDSGEVCDSCNERAADTCSFLVEITSAGIVIENQTGATGLGVVQGQPTTVSVSMLSTDHHNHPIGGFNFVIKYDETALNFLEALEGEFFVDCDWEYFTYRLGANANCDGGCPGGIVRLVGIADINNGAPRADCYVNDGIAEPGPGSSTAGELVLMRFLVSGDHTLECNYLPIRFMWFECGDNTLSNIIGDTLMISDQVYDIPDGQNFVPITDAGSDFPSLYGATVECDIVTEKSEPYRCVDFWNGGVKIICHDDIDAPGDINQNDIPYEVADAVMLTRYFLIGVGAFGPTAENHQDASIAASDANKDGIPLSISDLVYLIRVVVGDASPYPRVTEGSVRYKHDLNSGAVTVDGTLGGAYIIVSGDVTPQLLVDDMSMEYRFDGVNTRIVVVPSMAVGVVNGFGGEFLGGIENEIISIQLSTVAGHAITASNIPGRYSLSQNFPNPFNPTTTIMFSLPHGGRWNLSVFNVAGHTVAEFTGVAEPGVISQSWDASDHASGVYLYRLETDHFVDTKKMMLLK